MKTSNFVPQITTIFFLFCIFFIPACKNMDEQMTETTQKSDTIFKEVIDTVVVFDPETKIETRKIFKYVDTIVNGVPMLGDRDYKMNFINDTLDISRESNND